MPSTPLLDRAPRRARRMVGLAVATMLMTLYGQAGAEVGFEVGVSKFHTPTWGTNRVEGTPYSGRVWDIAVHEPTHTAYIVGEFTAIAPTLELAGAIDAASGLPQPGFPKIESGEVKAAVPDGAGGWYIGGNFKITLGGTESRVALARIRADGTVDSQWRPQLAQQNAAPSTVWALAVYNSYVYVGGDFTRFQGGFVRNHLARLSAATGTVDAGWDPGPDGTVVRSVAVSPDGAMVYVAGDFSTIKGQPRPGTAALRSQGAAVESWAPPLTGVRALAVPPDNARVYLGGDSLVATDLAGNQLWSDVGKVQTVAVSRGGSTVFAGGRSPVWGVSPAVTWPPSMPPPALSTSAGRLRPTALTSLLSPSLRMAPWCIWEATSPRCGATSGTAWPS